MTKKKKIMVVDDDPDIRMSVTQLLESSGYQVISVEDGIDAIDLLKKGEIPNLIILDIMMPVYSGWEVQRRIEGHLQWNNIPIIFLTGRGNGTAREMCERLGCGYVKKPFDIKNLKDVVEGVLKGKRKKQKVGM